MRERFHYKSFEWYVSRRLLSMEIFSFYIRNWKLVVLDCNDELSDGAIQDMIAESVIESIDEPHGAHDSARQRAVLDAPLDAHCRAVENALLIRKDYLSKRGVKCAGGVDGVEYVVDLKKVQGIVIETRIRKDIELASQLIEGDATISYRGLNDKARLRLGAYFSQSRIKTIMRGLDERGKTEVNGHLRSMGRDVL